LVCFGLLDLYCLILFALVWFLGCSWISLALDKFGLVWFASVWFSLLCLGLVWFGFISVWFNF